MSIYSTVALPFVVIWSKKTDDFIKLAEAEENESIKEYLKCLAIYRAHLTANNPRYNVPISTKTHTDLLARLNVLINKDDKDLGLEFKVAILNLQGLVQQYIGNTEEAKKIFTQARQMKGIGLLGFSAISSNMNFIFVEEKNEAAFLTCVKEIDERIAEEEKSGSLKDEETKQCLASVYASIAYRYRKFEKLSHGKKCFEKAASLWPQNNVIANNRAIFLSKLNNFSALKEAEEILAKLYDNAAQNHLFVTLYYRADVSVKLAAFALEKDMQYKTYVNTAEECLIAAERAANKNTDYSSNYKIKALSRVHLQRSNLHLFEAVSSPFLCRNFPFLLSGEHAKMAKNLREKVENDKTKDKFKEKFALCKEPERNDSFSSLFFRRQRFLDEEKQELVASKAESLKL